MTGISKDLAKWEKKFSAELGGERVMDEFAAKAIVPRYHIILAQTKLLIYRAGKSATIIPYDRITSSKVSGLALKTLSIFEGASEHKIPRIGRNTANEALRKINEVIDQARSVPQVIPQETRPPLGGAKFCSQCGAQQKPGDRFCSSCGAPIA